MALTWHGNDHGRHQAVLTSYTFDPKERNSTSVSLLASTKVNLVGRNYNTNYDFFQKEYAMICDALYKENRGR